MTVWTLHDPVGTLPDYSFAVVPTSDSPVYAKTVTNQSTVVPTISNKPLLYEGMDPVPVFSVQGDILTEDQYHKFLSWMGLRYQVMLTDDLSRQRYVYLTTFSPVRKRSATVPWRYTYTLSGYVISETFPSIILPPPPVAPTVTGLSPSLGVYTGGTSVTVTGTNFTGATAVTFGGLPVTYTVTSSTQITATSPAGTLGTSVHVQVTSGVASTETSADLFRYATTPSITSLSPTTGPDTGGQTVVITGTAFTGTTAVHFGSTAAGSFAVNSDTQITAVTPAEADATITVTVTTPLGAALSGSVAPSFVNGTVVASTSSVPSITLTTPTSLVVGNKLLAFVYGGDATAYSPAPTGWTLLAKNDENNLGMMAVYWRDVDGTEASTYTFSVTDNGWMAGAICQYTAAAAGLAGFDGAPTFIAEDAFSVAGGSIPAITAAASNELWVGAVGTYNGATISTPPGGFTLEVTQSQSGDDGITVWDKAASSGVNGPTSWVFDGTSTDAWGAVSVLLKGVVFASYQFLAPDQPNMVVM